MLAGWHVADMRATIVRARLALMALSLPILGMAGLFIWAGTSNETPDLSTPVDAALAFAHSLGTHDCAALYMVTTLRPGAPAASEWMGLCERASPRLVGLAVGDATFSAFPQRLPGLTSVGEVSLFFPGTRPTMNRPMNFRDGMVVLVGRPNDGPERVLWVVEPLLPAMGSRYGLNFQ
jgi:hypothetical protein